MTNFNIEIVSDTVCPWCYVGHRKLLSAISTFQTSHPSRTDTFTTTWKPFYLDPTSPKISIEKSVRYAQKFGPGRTEAIFARMKDVGKSVGIDFKFGGKTGNTRDSHRLIQLGKGKGEDVQTKVVETLFAAYFENEKDITQKDVLLEAAVKAGLDKGEAEKWLEGDDGGKEVDAEVGEAQERGISGVPHFTINGRFEIEGAQDSTAFVQLFERILKMDGQS
ncbi:thioredoxin-like protein [Venturia nashicola]|uniref:Thioredoxin-like protein n=1 Tax=Venturia nashicola TaxID=86259 RepID=A0A4Z1PNS4_9PEZI|nr:thioredoxin-like protein [Venturia nashicola]